VSDVNQSQATPPQEPSAALAEASRNPILGAQTILDSYKRNLEFIAEASRIRHDSFAAALQRRQEMIQSMLEQTVSIEGRTDAQQAALKKALERRLAAVRDFAEIIGASNQEFSDAAYRRMTEWCDEISRSLLGTEGSTGENQPVTAEDQPVIAENQPVAAPRRRRWHRRRAQ
jgi:hypothetical protein